MSLYRMKWDLDSLFKGGSHSPALMQAIEEIETKLRQLEKSICASLEIQPLILSLQDIEMRTQEVESFIGCLLAQDVSDMGAIQLQDRLAELMSFIKTLSIQINTLLIKVSDADFEALLAHKDMQPIAFSVQEQRMWTKEKLPALQEKMINQLSIDGYQGWDRFMRQS